MEKTATTLAVIYCRVSSERQVKEGAGIGSQKQRCESYAIARGYKVVHVFSDDGVSGAILDRPGLAKMLAFIRQQPNKVVVIIDDISRIARDVKTHIELRIAIRTAGGLLESPSMKFDDSAAGEFIELVLAASAHFGRTGNKEQVFNRQKARLEMGYWTFPAPIGYEYQKHPVHKKIIVPTEQAKTVLAAALEAFASGRLQTNRELALELQNKGFFPAKTSITILEKRITRLIDALPLYAGFIEYPRPNWNIDRVPAQHESIISIETFNKILLKSAASPIISPDRKDSNTDFILRNFIRCPECGKPLTGSYAKGKYPRYSCYNQAGCSRYGHSISAKVLMPAFEQMLKGVKPKEEVLEAVRILSTSVWNKHLKQWENQKKAVDSQLAVKDEEISNMVRRLARTNDDDIAAEIEKEVKKLKDQKLSLSAQSAKYSNNPPDYEEAFSRVSTLFSNPYDYWKNGSDKQKRTVHRVVFTVPPAFDRNMGFSTYSLTLPYHITTTFADSSSCLVEVARVALASNTGSVVFLHV